MAHMDAVNEAELILCCALCCANISVYPSCDCLGCSGKAGLCCCNVECCFKPGSPCLLPFGCVGLRLESDGLSFINGQCQACCAVITAAIPCNKEVPLALTVAGLTVYPKCGCFVKQREIMVRA